MVRIVRWENFTNKNYDGTNITLALKVFVKFGDYYDGVPEFFGKKINSWASWNADVVSHWKLDEGSGDAADAHGNNTGTVEGATQGVTGKIGDAYSFITNDYVNIPHNASLNLESVIGISVWVKPRVSFTLGGAIYMIIDKRPNAQAPVLALLWHPSDGLFFTDGVNALNSNITNMTGGVWHHIVVVVPDGKKGTIYVNGLNTTSSSAVHSLNTNSADLSIGRYDAGGYFDGAIDEVTLGAYEWTPDDVEFLYNSGDGRAYPWTVDSCTYSSGDWEVDMSDNCVISADVLMDGSDLIFTGAGTFRLESNVDITNFGKLVFQESDGGDIILEDGATLVQT